jgi:hypothetical protein
MKVRIAQAVILAFALVSLNVASTVRPAYAETFVLTLKPGEQAEIPFSFWCMDYGKPFPAAVATTGDRAPDSVIAVVRAAVAKGATTSDPYQTQLAIWRDIEGEFKDFANVGTVLAQEIYSDSLQTAVSPLPVGEVTLAEMIAQGAVSATVTGLTVTLPATPTIQPDQAFNGTGTLLLRNTSAESARFVVPEGLVVVPEGGINAQRLVSEPRGRPELPETGSTRPEMPLDLIVTFGAGAALFGLGMALAVGRGARRRQ